MEIRHLKYFVTVAKYGSISRAAQELNLAQPPLSKQLLKLEEDLNVSLFTRSKRGVKLTSEGELFLSHVQSIVHQFEELSRFGSNLRDGTVGEICIATVPSFVGVLGKALFEFWNNNPKVHLTIREGQSQSVINYVQSGDAQIGITRLPLNDSKINYHIISDDPVFAFANTDSSLSRFSRLTPEDLADTPILLVKSSLESSGFDQILLHFEESGVHPHIAGHVESTPTMLNIIKHGNMLGLAPSSGRYLQIPDLCTIPFGHKDIHTPIAIIWLKSQANSAVLRMRDHIIEECSLDL